MLTASATVTSPLLQATTAFRQRLRAVAIDGGVAKFVDAHVMGKRNRRSSDGQARTLTPVQSKVVTR